ncbi:MAG: DUF72 domain-containing protein [Candidatus Hodarchaeota archaeon]
MEIRIGAGGWAYFHVPGIDRLLAYSRAFDFVEVNSTFYEIPEYEMVKSWRGRVPADFEFSVRCHASVTHRHLLEPVTENIETFSQMIHICELLGSKYLHIMTPPKMELSSGKVQSIRDFLSSVNTGGVRLAWEIRSLRSGLTVDVVRTMEDFNIIHCVDLSTQTPSIESDVLYTRLFGKGHHNLYQFTDDELGEIYNKVKSSDVRKAIITFHPIKMYKDAARLKIFQKTGNFPKVTKTVGLKSLEEVLREDARFPSTKRELMKKQGWKVIDLTETKRVRAKHFLKKIQEGTYETIEEIINELK